MTHTVETRIKLSIHRYASRFSTLYIDENLLSVRKIFAAPLRTSYLKYALVAGKNIDGKIILVLHIRKIESKSQVVFAKKFSQQFFENFCRKNLRK